QPGPVDGPGQAPGRAVELDREPAHGHVLLTVLEGERAVVTQGPRAVGGIHLPAVYRRRDRGAVHGRAAGRGEAHALVREPAGEAVGQLDGRGPVVDRVGRAEGDRRRRQERGGG